MAVDTKKKNAEGRAYPALKYRHSTNNKKRSLMMVKQVYVRNNTNVRRFSLVALMASFSVACAPPTDVFNLETGFQFSGNSGTVIVQKLTSTTSVCYTTDGSTPVWSGGSCDGGSTQRIQGPVTAGEIVLACGDDTGPSVLRKVQITYDWEDTIGNVASADYYLNCSDDTGGGGSVGGGDTPTSDNSLQADTQLNSNEYLESTNGRYRLYLQTDGNVVLRDWDTREALWSTGTNGQDAVRLKFQGDGNLVLRSSSGSATWSSGTNGSGATRLVLNNDGSLALYDGNTPVWSVNGEGDTGGGNNGGGNNGGGSSDGVKIAFIGDTGAGSNFQNVLNLIKREGAELTIVAGDTSYSSSKDDNWDSMVQSTLGSSDPAIVAAGNHDYDDSNFSDVRSFGEARLNRATNVACTGSYAEKMTCQYKNVHIVLSAIGASGSRSSHESYIANSLNDAPEGSWRICAWHKNQRDMQVGGKSDEVGWTAYETCRQQGAIISTGHEHSYSRTHLLSDMSEKTIASTASTFTVTEGRTFAFVSGLGGIGIRDQERGGDWWSKIYTSTQGARYGAMFGTFYEDRADFYFKNIDGQVIDQFTVMKGY